jgi:parallel beta-helix repeat protein
MQREDFSTVRTSNQAAVSQVPKRTMRLTALLFASIVCLVPLAVGAADYYVAPYGADTNPGTPEAPFRTITAALVKVGSSQGAGAGSSVEVAAGTYTETLMFNLPSGTSWDQPFTLRARPGEIVTIQGSGETNIYIADGIEYYSVIDGFVFDGSNLWRPQVSIGSCCDPQPGSVRFQNNTFVNNRSGGFIITGHNVEILNNTVHGGFVEFSGCGQIHCFDYAFYVVGANNLFDGNEIYDVPSWVFHVYSPATEIGIPHSNIIRNNVIHDFGFGDERADGILVSSGAGNQVYNNTLYRGSNGIAVAWHCDGCTVLNNTVSNMNRCLQAGDSVNNILDSNALSNCGMYVDIWGDTPGVVVTNNECDKSAAYCASELSSSLKHPLQ